MKITGPGSAPSANDVPAAPETQPAEHTAFADKLTKASGTEAAPDSASRVEGAAAPKLASVSDIAADLQAGRISPMTAIDKVVERIVARQVSADAPAAVRAQVESALRGALEDDPLLAEKVRSLGS